LLLAGQKNVGMPHIPSGGGGTRPSQPWQRNGGRKAHSEKGNPSRRKEKRDRGGRKEPYPPKNRSYVSGRGGRTCRESSFPKALKGETFLEKRGGEILAKAFSRILEQSMLPSKRLPDRAGKGPGGEGLVENLFPREKKKKAVDEEREKGDCRGEETRISPELEKKTVLTGRRGRSLWQRTPG